ncbi:MAG: hypothetical protein ACREXW_11515 [Gammaproteobacteria bacterium]
MSGSTALICLMRVCLCDHGLEVAHLPGGAGILQQHIEDPLAREFALGVADFDLDAERTGARLEHGVG